MVLQAQTNVPRQLERAKEEGWGYDGSMATELEVLHLLTALVYVEKPDVVVETGTYNGHGTRALVAGLLASKKGHLWTVENDPEITEQLVGMDQPRTTFVDADSLEWAKSKDCPSDVDFGFVDCCVEPTGRVAVFDHLLDRITSGGLICVHDTEFYCFEDLLDPLVELAGPYSLHFPALNGFTVWRR